MTNLINRFQILLPLCLLMVFLSLKSQAASQGHGKVNMQGSVIETACDIAMEDRDQLIEMPIEPVMAILSENEIPSVSFAIHFRDCSLSSNVAHTQTAERFGVTFDGLTDDGRLFAVQGEASGAALEIRDSFGNRVVPGKVTEPKELNPQYLELDYSLRLKPNSRRLVPGSYSASIRFKVDYF